MVKDKLTLGPAYLFQGPGQPPGLFYAGDVGKNLTFPLSIPPVTSCLYPPNFYSSEGVFAYFFWALDWDFSYTLAP